MKKLASWNVNSLKVRLPQLLAWLEKQQPDFLCLQETKLADEAFPREPLEAAGYRCAFSGQRTYNGVAILAREPLEEIARGIPGFPDEQKRAIAASVGSGETRLRIVCLYVPNGQAVGSDKYRYKLEWLAALRDWLREELQRYPLLAVAGDYNVAPSDADVHDPKLWQGQVLCSEPERRAFQALLELGLKDAVRLFTQAPGLYTWWDYRIGAFRRNFGLRIDHILLSSALAERCRSSTIDLELRRAERPSDHAAVIAELDL